MRTIRRFRVHNANSNYADLRADIGIALASTNCSQQNMFQKCCDAFYTHLDLVLASIWLFDSINNNLTRIAVSGNEMEVDMTVVPVNKYAVGHVASEKKALYINDISDYEDFADPNWAKRKNVKGFAGFPIIFGERLIGVIAFYSNEEIPSNTRETLLLLTDLMAQGIMRYETNEILEQERNFFSAISSATTGYLFVFEPDGKVLFANNGALERLAKKGIEEVNGKRIMDLIGDPVLSAAIETWFVSFSNDHSKNSFEINEVDELGVSRCISWCSDAIYNEDGSIKYIISNGTDLTEVRKGEEALRKSEAKLRKLFDSSLVGLAITHLDGEISEANDKFLSMLGLTREEFEAEHFNWRELTPPGYEEIEDFAILQCKNQGFATPFEKEYFRKDGSTIPILLAIAGLTEDELFTVFVLDRTDLKTTEEALIESKQALIRSQKLEAIGRLAGGIAHDFNNLLTVIHGYCEIGLSQAKGNPALIRNLEEIRKAGIRASELTKQLLAFSRKQVIQSLPLNINEIIVYMDGMLERIIGEDVNIQVELEPDIPLINGDKGQFEQILLNLAVNAREAMPFGGLITITTEKLNSVPISSNCFGFTTKPVVKVSFSDTGVGMTDDVKDRLFEPFFTTKPEGTGLGLATIYGIVTQFDGCIDVESSNNSGTNFMLYFPVCEDHSTNEYVSDEQTGIYPRNETILIVEDENMVRNLTSETLQNHGFNVITADGGSRALRMINAGTQRIDLVLTDVIMPNMNGIDFVQKLRTISPKIKVVFMSGYAGPNDSSNSAFFENEPFIQKPFDTKVLVQTVIDVLGAEDSSKNNSVPQP
ncbi:MAG: response regulator [Pyrinomonadaceae bacterium]